ncbi:DUF4129 domain-containing protein [Hymenobacter sp. BRD128]|uniref:DUF4129 domain-containing protein n=1 Tax=Hymenobacter sp. BRD128 TaxID=2675878 RepID=UPI001563D523|nr:DUF4129 domain-containing protein [Hymenobacter sp. BRD128]QKG57483.1 DUF4129 domain-containing protein [Hymenobacter sp. BRD128]
MNTKRRSLVGLLAFGLALAAGPAARAQTAPSVSAPAPAVRLRQPPAATARLDELRRQHAFDYREAPPASEEASSAWSRFWARFFEWLLSKLNWMGGYTYDGFWRWVIYGLLAAAVIFVVLKLLQVDLTRAFGRAPRRDALDYETLSENIHELDFPTQLREAEEAGNLRLAVRLGYLALLKQLSDKNLITWQPDKTNQTYLREVASQRPALRPPFAELTRQFEYVWYGELPLTPPQYTEVRAAQLALGHQLGGRAVSF